MKLGSNFSFHTFCRRNCCSPSSRALFAFFVSASERFCPISWYPYQLVLGLMDLLPQLICMQGWPCVGQSQHRALDPDPGRGCETSLARELQLHEAWCQRSPQRSSGPWSFAPRYQCDSSKEYGGSNGLTTPSSLKRMTHLVSSLGRFVFLATGLKHYMAACNIISWDGSHDMQRRKTHDSKDICTCRTSPKLFLERNWPSKLVDFVIIRVMAIK